MSFVFTTEELTGLVEFYKEDASRDTFISKNEGKLRKSWYHCEPYIMYRQALKELNIQVDNPGSRQ